MRVWIKLMPFFIVCWFARKYCSRIRVGTWDYVQPFGPGQKHSPEAIVLVEVDVKNRKDWYP